MPPTLPAPHPTTPNPSTPNPSTPRAATAVPARVARQPRRFIGRCRHCGTPIGATFDVRPDVTRPVGRHARCGGCHRKNLVHAVRGRRDPAQPCTAACRDAAGPDCTCSCAGTNHALSHQPPTTGPSA